MLTAHSVESTCTPRAPPHFLLEPKGDDAAVGGVSRCLQSPRCAEESSVRRCAQTGRTGPVVKRKFNVKPGRHSERKQVSLSFSLNRSFENIQELFFTSSYLLLMPMNVCCEWNTCGINKRLVGTPCCFIQKVVDCKRIWQDTETNGPGLWMETETVII